VRDQITVVKFLSNPFAWLKLCDGFILPSLYEGRPTVIFEADILGLPQVATDVRGSHQVMTELGGKLIPDSLAGVEQGLRELINHEVPLINADVEAGNERSVAAFVQLL
jgi:CDP-glycerol glycerophosphotransferase